MRSHPLIVAFVVSAALLGGCGGGGGSRSSSSAYPPGPVNLSSAPGETALMAYLQASHNYTLKANSGGNSYTLQVSHVANAGTTKFNGSAPAYSSVDTLTLDENAVRLAISASADYFLLHPYVPLGRVSSTGSPYGVVTSSTPLPTTLEVGSSGDVDSLTYYHDSAMSALDAHEEDTYSVRANNTTTLLLCLDSTMTNVTAQGTADDLVDDTQSDCYSIDAAGNAALVSITLTVNGVDLTFR